MTRCVLACVAVLGLIGPALADDVAEYQAFAVHNATGRAITYEVSWGGGPWRVSTVMPGRALIHSHIDYADTPAPTPRLRVAVAGRAYSPLTNRVQEKRDAYRHFFRADAAGNVSLRR